ncbi:MAG: hypothetical protein IJ684_02395 [Bacteroidales bacterium]|nr:hypothetical protein [Bacteroidales bacterium]
MKQARYIWFLAFALLPALQTWAQSDSVASAPTPVLSQPDTLPLPFSPVAATDSLRDAQLRCAALDDSLQQMEATLTRLMDRLDLLQKQKDSLELNNTTYQQTLQEQNRLLEDKITALQEKETLVAEKEQLYKDAVNASSVDRAKLEFELRAKEVGIEAKEAEIALLQRNIDARDSSLKDEKANYARLMEERNRYLRQVDSLRARVVAADMEYIKKQEENKYLAERAKAAEERVAVATNRKKKVRPVQGISMRFYRTPQWDIRLTPESFDGTQTTYHKVVWNRNAGPVEFDYTTGATVMLWDLSRYFNSASRNDTLGRGHELRRFDQQFSYDLSFYVGFGGSNLFKNFYVGPSFRFVDFFYLTVGINVAEYEVLSTGYYEGQVLNPVETLDNIVSKSWLIKPFISLSIDLDFLSYIKK